MELTEERKGLLMAYCRIEPEELRPEEHLLLETLYLSAMDYMKDAGVSVPEQGTGRAAKFDLCVNYLVLDAWDKREAVITGASVSGNPMFRLILNQLMFTEEADSE